MAIGGWLRVLDGGGHWGSLPLLLLPCRVFCLSPLLGFVLLRRWFACQISCWGHPDLPNGKVWPGGLWELGFVRLRRYFSWDLLVSWPNGLWGGDGVSVGFGG